MIDQLSGGSLLSRAKHLVARWPWTASILLASGAILLRAALLPLLPHPVPLSHDEASHAFQAEIFADGRLAFPTHPLWRFFQVEHVISHPVWMSKYFGGQALFLAAGVLLGNVHWGVVLSFALFVIAAHWLLRQIAPPQWALIGALAVFVIFNVGHYWLETMWGGFVAAAGGCFTLGALLSRPSSTSRARWFLPLGAVLLCTTRPFEGLVFVILSSSLFLIRTREKLAAQVAPWVAPFGVATLLSTVVVLGYGWLTLGRPLRLPYLEHERQYATASPFWFLSERTQSYDDPVIASFHQHWEGANLQRLVSMPVVRRIPFLMLRYAKSSVFDVFGWSFPPLLLTLLYWKNRRIRRLAILWILMAIPLSLQVWMFPHYTAPVTSALLALGVCVARAVHADARRNPLRLQIATIGLLFIVFVPGLIQDVYAVARHVRAPASSARQRVIDALQATGSRSAIFVRYTRLDWHAAYDDWVRNSPRVDDQPIIWARDRAGENEELIRYYPGRKFWLLNPDENPLQLQPYFGGAPLLIP